MNLIYSLIFSTGVQIVQILQKCLPAILFVGNH